MQIVVVFQNSSGECYEYFYLTNEEDLRRNDIMEAMLSSQYPPQIDFALIYSKELDEEGLSDYMNATGDFINYGININMPENRSWISVTSYKDMGDSLIRVNYYDMILKADMILRAGPRKAVFEKSRAGLEESLAEWEYDGNTYLIYGDTKEEDGSPAAKTASYIIEHFEKK